MGKVLLLSYFIDGPDEILRLNDLFENQNENISNSGKGNLDIFLSNLARLNPQFRSFKLYKQSSAHLTVADTAVTAEYSILTAGTAQKKHMMILLTPQKRSYRRWSLSSMITLIRRFPAYPKG